MTIETATTETTQESTTAATEQPWHGLTDEVEVGYMKNKGWDAPDSAPKVVKSYRELEKMMGTMKGSPERLLVMPSDFNNKDEVDAFYGKLGRPADVAGYSFAKTEGLNPEVATKLATAFHTEGLNDKQASAAFATITELAKEVNEKHSADVEAYTATEIEEVRKAWGNAYPQNLLLTNKAATVLGLEKQDLDNLEAALGPKKMLTMLADIGKKMGEAPALGLGNNNQSFIDTPGQAKAKMEEFRADKQAMNDLLDESSAGHAAAKAKYKALQNAAFPA